MTTSNKELKPKQEDALFCLKSLMTIHCTLTEEAIGELRVNGKKAIRKLKSELKFDKTPD